jgi:glucose-1-phosphate thymidylyltransferase
MLEANRVVLEDIAPKIEGELLEGSRVEGRVVIGAGTKIVGSVIRGPAIIGRDCLIDRSYVGPFTSIDDRTQVVRSEVEHSIILADCNLYELPARIEGSLLGRGASVRRGDGVPRSLRLVMGDSSSAILP